jgi:hypothetical protein
MVHENERTEKKNSKRNVRSGTPWIDPYVVKERKLSNKVTYGDVTRGLII